MLNIIKESYLLFLKKLPLWIAFIVPLAAFSYLDEYVRAKGINSWSLRFGGVLLVALIEIAVFKYAGDLKLEKGWRIVKNVIFITVFQVVFSVIMMLPVIIAIRIAQHHQLLSPEFLFFSYTANIFLGGWCFAKFNSVMPMVAAGDKLSWEKIGQYTKGSYKDWLWVSLLLYFPYVCSLYLISCIFTSIVVNALFLIAISIFNVLYYQSRK